MPKIRCPRCKKLNTVLKDGIRDRQRGYVRMRKCLDCEKIFSTVESYSKGTLEEVKNENQKKDL